VKPHPTFPHPERQHAQCTIGAINRWKIIQNSTFQNLARSPAVILNLTARWYDARMTQARDDKRRRLMAEIESDAERTVSYTGEDA